MTERGRPLGVLVAAVLAWAGAMQGSAAGPDLQTVLDLATAYELKFIANFENVVAEEVYVQEISSPRRKRTMKSDFLFVKYPDVEGSMALRDVFEVDGKPVRDAAQSDRMMKLFTSPVADAILRARALAQEGARYNLLDIGTLNNPVLTMVFLQPNYRPRFRFNLAGIEKSLGPTIRTVRFEEFRIPSILKSGSNYDMLSRGLIWVDEETGRVVKTPAAGRPVPHASGDRHHLPPRAGPRHRRAGRDAGLVSRRARRHPRRRDVRPLPALPGQDRRDD